MPLTRGQEVHPGTVWIWREPNERWSQATCSFCGSVMPVQAAEWLSNGNDASGSDWKNDWPHKFYVTDDDGREWKLYTEHLTELGPDTFRAVTSEINSALHILFSYDLVDRMIAKAPSKNYQTWRFRGAERGVDSSQRAWELRQDEEILSE